jgi:REP element-mobilizing transposase RayT
MAYDPSKHHRRSIRLKGYDYARAGAYFITICTRDRACIFGDVAAGKMRLNELGKIVQATWNHLPDHYQVELDAFVVMPNHVHGIVVIPGTMAGTGTHPDAGDPPDPVGAGLKPAPTSPAVPNVHATSSPAVPNVHATSSPAVPNVHATSSPAVPNVHATSSPAVPNNPVPSSPAVPDNPAASSGTRPKHHGLPEIVRGFKTFSARRINERRHMPGTPVWQRNYYEHIIRDGAALRRIRRYIANNPAQWVFDRNRPSS